MPEIRIAGKYPTRGVGHVPSGEEDPFGAFSRVCRIEGSGQGTLAGKTIGVKDNIAVAGVPSSNGSRTMSHVPSTDASSSSASSTPAERSSACSTWTTTRRRATARRACSVRRATPEADAHVWRLLGRSGERGRLRGRRPGAGR